jgi:glucokinase
VRSRTFPTLAEKTLIRYASLGGDAGYIGAAGLARLAHRAG